MAESQRIVDALKRALRAQGVSYAQVARRLALSESSVKRLFSTGSFSLARLEAVCDLVGLDLLELARRADARRFRMPALTVDQEREVVSDPALLLVAVCALNRWPFERILDRYGFTEPRLVGLLARLDHMELVELLPGNRIRLRIDRNFAWLPDGPIHRFFVDRLQSEFLAGAFQPERDVHRVAWGMLSAESAAALRGRIAELTEAFDELTRGDEVRADSAARGTCLLVALREWEPSPFRALLRPVDGP